MSTTRGQRIGAGSASQVVGLGRPSIAPRIGFARGPDRTVSTDQRQLWGVRKRQPGPSGWGCNRAGENVVRAASGWGHGLTNGELAGGQYGAVCDDGRLEIVTYMAVWQSANQPCLSGWRGRGLPDGPEARRSGFGTPVGINIRLMQCPARALEGKGQRCESLLVWMDQPEV